MLKNTKAFTLIEILISVLIFSTVIIAGFYAYSSIMIGKSRLIESTDIQKDSFYFSEKLFEMIKKGGVLDYEEYFNRKVVGTDTLNGHYEDPTGFGNFGPDGIIEKVSTTADYGTGFYQCISGENNPLGTDGCYGTGSLNTIGDSLDREPQRYGQYSFQFIDYNANYDDDNGNPGDENGDGRIMGDDDDEYLGNGPNVFDSGTNIKELYLISGDGKKRTYFRWNVGIDPNAPDGTTCTDTTGSGCLGTIEFLVLDGVDYGLDHASGSTDDITEYDGVVDTWLINKEFTGGEEIVAGSDDKNYRVNLFPDSINVSDFEVYAFPNIDIENAWNSNDASKNISPYAILNFEIKPSWLTKRKLKKDSPAINFTTTINLTDIYSK